MQKYHSVGNMLLGTSSTILSMTGADLCNSGTGGLLQHDLAALRICGVQLELQPGVCCRNRRHPLGMMRRVAEKPNAKAGLQFQLAFIVAALPPVISACVAASACSHQLIG